MSAALHSCLYEGKVRHRRMAPVRHEFSYRLYYAYLDLDELAEGKLDSHWFSGSAAWAPFRFARQDYLAPHDVSLKQAVCDLVASRLGRRPQGPVRLLTQVRCLGMCFNPVSFYYCFDQSGTRLEALVAEINNTPWNERYAYVLDVADRGPMRFTFAKDFHVSPFMPMAMDYDWSFTPPGQRLNVVMRNLVRAERKFDVILTLTRQPFLAARLSAQFVRYPLIAVKITTAIYYQALRLMLKGAPFYHHPTNQEPILRGNHDCD